MATKLTRLTHKIAIRLHLVAESCTICSSRSRRPVRKLLVNPRISARIIISKTLFPCILFYSIFVSSCSKCSIASGADETLWSECVLTTMSVASENVLRASVIRFMGCTMQLSSVLSIDAVQSYYPTGSDLVINGTYFRTQYVHVD
jgi:hypothetical protein